jgi:DDE superfamily endonuclease/Fission yeast centromere protein N-terminal domain/Tc5 transposase DNA-binding domain
MPRRAITSAERAALRAWFHQQYPKPRHAVVIKWFLDKFQHQISQSTVSESLSDHWRHLDSPDLNSNSRLQSKRQREGKWPLLERILVEWQQHIESRGGSTSGDILIEKAKQIWPQIPEYSSIPLPEFSDGWLEKFKRRHHIRKRIQHGEAGSIPEGAEEEMGLIRTLCGEYPDVDVYNMDESGLFYRRGINAGLATEVRPGLKKDKSRISIGLCTNATGTDRLPPLFIGHAKQPRALRGINIQALGGWWRHNQKAWMTTLIMVEWLYSFYTHIGLRRVLLLMDNFSAHIKAIELAPPPENIRIQWLPPNATSVFQPLDQGIIQNTKVYYRKQLLRFSIESYKRNVNPTSCITVYHAIKWLCQAWIHDVDNSTIMACFQKSTAISSDLPSTIPSRPDLSQLYQNTASLSGIRDIMSLSNFLNPLDEDEEVDNTYTLEDIVQQHLQSEITEEAILEEEENDQPPQIISKKQALHAVQELISFQEQQDDTQYQDLQALNRLQRLIQTKITSS